jgi:leader peptidase (prepilin peptidase)/N-methyltransferase
MEYTLLVLLGLVIGSFVSAVSYRIPRGIGFVTGRSFCDNCKKELYWYDNIPIFSFLFYRGKSRCCDKKISPRYPLIEVVSAIGSVVIFSVFGLVLYPVTYTLFSISLAIFIIDLEHQIIPDELTWLLLLLAFLYPTTQWQASLIPYSLFPILFTGFFFSLLFLFLHLITKGRGMGLGDVKLAIPLALILGFEKSWTWIFASFVIGGIVASILLLLKRANLKTKIAFGPFMILAFWIVLIFI